MDKKSKPYKENVESMDDDEEDYDSKINNKELDSFGGERLRKRRRRRAKKNRQQELPRGTVVMTTSSEKENVEVKRTAVGNDKAKPPRHQISLEALEDRKGSRITVPLRNSETKTPCNKLPLSQLNSESVDATDDYEDEDYGYEDSERSKLRMSDSAIWCMMNKNALPVDELYELGFPVDMQGEVIFYRPTAHQKLNPIAKEFNFDSTPKKLSSTPDQKQECCSTSDGDQPASGQQEQQISSKVVSCARCSSMYSLNAEGRTAHVTSKCLYHCDKTRSWYDKNGVLVDSCFVCCDGISTSAGCTMANSHVWSGYVDGHNHAPATSFVRTDNGMCDTASSSASLFTPQRQGIYGLDCEMCYTSLGFEVTKVTLVNVRGVVVYDTLVRTSRPIVDYNTRFSGITAEDFDTKPSKTLRQVQRDLMKYIGRNTVLVGHGLCNDLLALKMIHLLVVDTLVLFSHPKGEPYKPSLKKLANNLLKRSIQKAFGHDSKEDARAAMDLALYKIRRSIEEQLEHTSGTVQQPEWNYDRKRHFDGQRCAPYIGTQTATASHVGARL